MGFFSTVDTLLSVEVELDDVTFLISETGSLQLFPVVCAGVGVKSPVPLTDVVVSAIGSMLLAIEEGDLL